MADPCDLQAMLIAIVLESVKLWKIGGKFDEGDDHRSFRQFKAIMHKLIIEYVEFWDEGTRHLSILGTFGPSWLGRVLSLFTFGS